MSKHTPGPWLLRTHSVTGNRSLFSPQATCTVAQLVDCHDSDAALMAAAPELLEALKKIAAGDEMKASHGTWTHADTVLAYQAIAAKAAAKAEGRA